MHLNPHRTQHCLHKICTCSPSFCIAWLHQAMLCLSCYAASTYVGFQTCAALAAPLVLCLCQMTSTKPQSPLWGIPTACICSTNDDEQNTGLVVQENEIKDYKHQIKAERKARKAAESWLRSELKSRVSAALPSAAPVICYYPILCNSGALACRNMCVCVVCGGCYVESCGVMGGYLADSCCDNT